MFDRSGTARGLGCSVTAKGDRDIERNVQEEIASYGRQIGWLQEAVPEMALKKHPELVNPLHPQRARQSQVASFDGRRARSGKRSGQDRAEQAAHPTPPLANRAAAG